MNYLIERNKFFVEYIYIKVRLLLRIWEVYSVSNRCAKSFFLLLKLEYYVI